MVKLGGDRRGLSCFPGVFPLREADSEHIRGRRSMASGTRITEKCFSRRRCGMTLIRPPATFSRREKGILLGLHPPSPDGRRCRAAADEGVSAAGRHSYVHVSMSQNPSASGSSRNPIRSALRFSRRVGRGGLDSLRTGDHIRTCRVSGTCLRIRKHGTRILFN